MICGRGATGTNPDAGFPSRWDRPFQPIFFQENKILSDENHYIQPMTTRLYSDGVVTGDTEYPLSQNITHLPFY